VSQGSTGLQFLGECGCGISNRNLKRPGKPSNRETSILPWPLNHSDPSWTLIFD